MIWQVRDPIEERRKARSKEDKEHADEAGFVTELADLGAEDKRLLVIESELASVLERMGRDGNTLSPCCAKPGTATRCSTRWSRPARRKRPARTSR